MIIVRIILRKLDEFSSGIAFAVLRESVFTFLFIVLCLDGVASWIKKYRFESSRELFFRGNWSIRVGELPY